MDIKVWFLLFFIYSVLGWFCETMYVLIGTKKLVNRGFLIGPYCPIYGAGCVLMVMFLRSYVERPILLFTLAVLICSVLEYMTSFIMEKCFNARWWDYSDSKFNINGRICLRTMLPFGLGACVLLYVVNPGVMYVLKITPDKVINIIFWITFVIMATDVIVSTHIINNFNRTVKTANEERRDNTEEITDYVRQTLMKKSYFYRRLVRAFPHFKAKIKNVLEGVAEKI